MDPATRKALIEKIDNVLAFAWYLSWADFHATVFKEEMDREDEGGNRTITANEHQWRWFASMSYWYASLNVVVEAWDHLEFSDDIIGRLLAMPEMRELLRRYRNAVLHFQSPITTPKFLEFLQKGEAHVFWVHALHYEFVRFLRDYLSGLSASDEDAQEFRQMIEGVIHWYPYRHHRDLDKAEQLARTVRELLKNSGDDSEQRQSLVSALEEAEKVVEQSDFGRLRGEFLRRAGIE